jgi:hypothetical protein
MLTLAIVLGLPKHPLCDGYRLLRSASAVRVREQDRTFQLLVTLQKTLGLSRRRRRRRWLLLVARVACNGWSAQWCDGITIALTADEGGGKCAAGDGTRGSAPGDGEGRAWDEHLGRNWSGDGEGVVVILGAVAEPGTAGGSIIVPCEAWRLDESAGLDLLFLY